MELPEILKSLIDISEGIGEIEEMANVEMSMRKDIIDVHEWLVNLEDRVFDLLRKMRYYSNEIPQGRLYDGRIRAITPSTQEIQRDTT